MTAEPVCLAGAFAHMDIELAAGRGGRKRSAAEDGAVLEQSSKRARTVAASDGGSPRDRVRTLSDSDALQLPGDGGGRGPPPLQPARLVGQLRGPSQPAVAARLVGQPRSEGGHSDTDEEEGGRSAALARALRLALAPAARELLARAARPPPSCTALGGAPPAAAAALAIVPYRPGLSLGGAASGEHGGGGNAQRQPAAPEPVAVARGAADAESAMDLDL
jgi:hypothetical protein